MTKEPKVTFIICTYNRAAYLDKALYSLLKKFSLSNMTFDLLVVDNNSSDHTPAIVQKYQDEVPADKILLRYVKEKNQGLTHARNRGIQDANTPYIVFLDDDIQASESLISTWISFFSNNTDAVAAGGKIHVKFDEIQPSWVSHFLLPLFGRHDFGKQVKKYPAGKSPFGGNMGFKKSIFKKAGNFDPDLGKKGALLYAKGEEKELFQRIRSISNDIYYLPNAFLYHHVDGSRLTSEYVKKQALGIGRGMKLQLNEASFNEFITKWVNELGKLFASIILGVFYFCKLQSSKTTMLLKFRWWIFKGYFSTEIN